MRKSPAKWIKSVLLGKKSTKSKDLTKAANNKPVLSENPPVVSEPVLVNSNNAGTVSTVENTENGKLPNGGAVQAMGQGVESLHIAGSKTPTSTEKLSEELAAVKAQAAFRGYLARRAFRALKGIIRLQALIRGHLVRRQAASTLRVTWLIVKLQALVRGRNVRLSIASMQIILKSGQHKFLSDKPSDAWKEKVSSNAYVQKLLSSSTSHEALHLQYDERDPNSLYNWLERWTIIRIWKSASQPKKVADGKPQVRKASYAMETESAKLKRNVRKSSAVTVDNFQTNMTVEPEKLKRTSRKFSSSTADSVPDSQLSELEKVKRNLRKVTNSMAEASKISSSRADASKVSSSMADASKVSSSTADASKVSDSTAQIPPNLVNGISDHQDNQGEDAQQNACVASFSPDTQELHSGNLLEDNSHMNLLEPDLISNPETPFTSILTWEKFNDTTANAQAVEVLLLQNIDNEDNFLEEKEQPRSKEESLSNGSLKTSKRRSSFSTKSEYPENGTQNTPVPRRKPSYMAATESAKAKLRGQNSPLDSDSPADMNGFTRRQSLPSVTNNRAIKAEWRRHRFYGRRNKLRFFALEIDLLSDASTSRAARHLFDAVPRPTPALCGTLISALSRLSSHRELLDAFSSLHRRGSVVPPGCVPLVVKSCALSAASRQGRQVHCHAIVRGLLGDTFVLTALVDFYAKNGDMDCAVKVFEEMPVKDPIPMNCLITGYSKSGDVDKARRLFDGMTRRTSASWNSMIACYAYGGEYQEALRLFDRMLSEGARPNAITIATVFSICAKTGDLERGKWARSLIAEEDLRNMIVHTALMEMYVKCRAIDEARHEFDRMQQRDVVAWSTMIAGYAQNGRPHESLELFERMKATSCKPNEVTLVGVLSACAQLGSDEFRRADW